ncbi:hypothetical protein DA2_3620 [Desulfovibrio sp. A2]|nr:hypothetical protein DA2_3620 [Desulfovibrio sp. A2]
MGGGCIWGVSPPGARSAPGLPPRPARRPCTWHFFRRFGRAVTFFSAVVLYETTFFEIQHAEKTPIQVFPDFLFIH